MENRNEQTRPLSTRYFIRENFEYKDDEVIHYFDEIYEFITNYKCKQEFVRIICDNSIETGGVVLPTKTRHCRKSSHCQLQLCVRLPSRTKKEQYSTSACNMKGKTKNIMRFSWNIYASFYKAMVNKNLNSTYHPQFLTIMDEYNMFLYSECYQVFGPTLRSYEKPRFLRIFRTFLENS